MNNMSELWFWIRAIGWIVLMTAASYSFGVQLREVRAEIHECAVMARKVAK